MARDHEPETPRPLRPQVAASDTGVFARIFESAAVPIAQVAPDGRFLRVNEAYCELTGYGADELLAGGFQQITHPDDLSIDLHHVEELLAGRGERYSMDKRYIRMDGRSVWVNLSVSLVRDGEGRPDFFVAVAEKIDERKQAKAELAEREAQLRTIVETVPVGLVMAELPSGRIVGGNRFVEQMLRHPVLYSKDVQSYEEWVCFHEDGRRVSAHEYPLARMALEGEDTPSLDVNYRRGDGTFRWIRIIGRSIKNAGGKVVGGVVALVDIDEEKRAWDRVQAQVSSLQSQLIHTSRVSAMGTMASALAHELNQPLTAITNYMRGLKRLLEKAGVEPDHQLFDAADEAEKCALRAGDIIRGVRAMMTRREIKPQTCNVLQLIEEAAAIALIGAAERGISYRQNVSPALAVSADPLQVQQVLINLVRNGVEALAGAERRELCISAAAEGEWVRLWVADSGSGLAPELRETLFEPFSSGKQDGMGVGLSICRTIIEAHEGRIWFEERPGGGTVVHFLLPVPRD